MGVKAAALAALTQDAFVPLWRSLVSDFVVVLMLHRFADEEMNIRGDSPDALRANLEFLRRHRFHLASLNEVIDGNTGQAPAGPTVVFTVDDGYADFARIAAPIFAEFDCPVTVFVVTKAIDQQLWFWWDRIEYIIESSRRDEVNLELSTGLIRRPRLQHGSVRQTISTLGEALKRVPEAEKEEALVSLASVMEVDVPDVPPPQYAAMTWDDVRRCAAQGVVFGPHTVRHPMLTQVDPATATEEMIGSWNELQRQCDSTVPVFCYPNGAYNRQHIEALARSPMRAAITTKPRYTTHATFVSPDPGIRYAIPRFPYSSNREDFIQVVAGVERIKMGMRDVFRSTRG